MLKGKRVLTDDYFGKVLNDAEKESVLILEVIRERVVRRNSQDSINVMLGIHATGVWWRVINPTVVAVPWSEVGRATICELVPKMLHARYLRRF